MPVTTTDWASLIDGSTLGNYRLDGFLGRGAFGLVFEAIDLRTGHRFAAKVLQPGASFDAVSDFANEGALLAQLRSQSAVIHHVHTGTGSVSLPMVAPMSPVALPVQFHILNLASGSLDELTLDPQIRAGWGWTDRLRLYGEAINCVARLHANFIAHRDIKASNCLLVKHGQQLHVRFGDLGRSKDLRVPPAHHLTAYLIGRGDPSFAPPEYLWLQGNSEPDSFLKADYYGLGSLLVEMTTGHPLSLIAMGDVNAVLRTSQAELAAGNTRSLRSLEPRFGQVFGEVSNLMPLSIRSDAEDLLTVLAAPDPVQRLHREGIAKKGAKDLSQLDWAQRKVKMMQKRLIVDGVHERRRKRESEKKSA